MAMVIEEDYGPLLWRRRRGGIALGLGVASLVLGIGLAAAPLDPPISSVVGPGFAGVGLALLALGAWLRRKTTFVHERGLVQGSRRLAYRDATGLTVKTVVAQAEGYTSVTYRCMIRGEGPEGPVAIRVDFGASRRATTRRDELIALVAPAIGDRMRLALRRGESVAWAGGAIEPGGLRFGPGPVVPFGAIRVWEVVGDNLTVDLPGARRFQLATGLDDFYPGYRLVAELRRA